MAMKSVVTKPRLVAVAMSVAVIAGLNRTQFGRQLLGNTEQKFLGIF